MHTVYTIYNKNTAKYYIGRTNNWQRRKSQHFALLRRGNHHCALLQEAYNVEGDDVFVFSVLQHCETLQEALNLEQLHLDTCKEQLYNVSPHAWEGGDVITAHPYRETVKEHIGSAKREQIAQLSKEERQKLYGNFGVANPNYKGGVHLICPQCTGKKSYYATLCKNCKVLHNKNLSIS